MAYHLVYLPECVNNIAPKFLETNQEAIDKEIIRLETRVIAIEGKFAQMQWPETHEIGTTKRRPEATIEQAMQGTPGFALPA